MSFDIYMVGVGGQGILTIGEIIAKTAMQLNLNVNFYPTKGMAQRGGFVKAQLRIGHENGVGPDIGERGADIAISMEISETLKAIRYVKRGGTVVLYTRKWLPTDVMLGNAPYPEIETVAYQCRSASVRLVTLKALNDNQVADNIAVLGTAVAATGLSSITPPKDIYEMVFGRFPKAVEKNAASLSYGETRFAVID
ncbi:MAG: 2-oxoacid:acceptor oxidoreductase family protein [Clostridia bacterium]